MAVKRPRGPLGAGRAACAAGLVVLSSLCAAAVPSAPARAASVDAVAEQAGRSVVTVIAQRTVTRAVRRASRPVTSTHTRVGSGVAVGESTVLTTASVMLGAERVLVRTSNGLQAEAKLVGMDLVFNVALLRLPTLRLPWLGVSESPARLGDQVIVLGSSYGAQPTRSVGTVEYVYREPRSSLLQLTNIVFPGNSGAAALNAQGRLVGIVQGEMGAPDPGTGRTGGARRPSGMSFVMPIGELRPVYESLERTGRMPHGFLGVSTSAEVVRSEVDGGEVGLGARVESVREGGPAARAGLRRGDLIVAFDDVRFEYPEQLARWVSQTRPGTAVKLVWARDDLRREGTARLGEATDSLPSRALPAERPAVAPVSGGTAAGLDSARR
jgi:S1-C subfamily serine protease